MTTRVKDLLNEASSLTDGERAELAACLLDSLEPSPEGGVDEAWAKEVERRVAEIRAGNANVVPWEQVRQEALRALNAATRR